MTILCLKGGGSLVPPDMPEVCFPFEITQDGTLQRCYNTPWEWSTRSATKIPKEGLRGFFPNTACTKADFPLITSIDSRNSLDMTFYECTSLETVSFPELIETTLSGSTYKSAFGNTFYGCTKLKNISFPKLTTLRGAYIFDYTFRNCTNLESVSFDSLVTTSVDTGYSAHYTFQYTFRDCSKLTTVNFPLLETIKSNCFEYTFYRCTSLTSMEFPNVQSIETYGFHNAFDGCTSLSSLSFPALTTVVTNSFVSALNGVTGCTVHFPSNLEGNAALTTSKLGGTNTTILFDLPAIA